MNKDNTAKRTFGEQKLIYSMVEKGGEVIKKTIYGFKKKRNNVEGRKLILPPSNYLRPIRKYEKSIYLRHIPVFATNSVQGDTSLISSAAPTRASGSLPR